MTSLYIRQNFPVYFYLRQPEKNLFSFTEGQDYRNAWKLHSQIQSQFYFGMGKDLCICFAESSVQKGLVQSNKISGRTLTTAKSSDMLPDTCWFLLVGLSGDRLNRTVMMELGSDVRKGDKFDGSKILFATWHQETHLWGSYGANVF